MTLRSRFFAATYDRQMAKVEKAGLRAHRESVLAEATGRVLEIGAGTGGNLPFYGPGVESLTMTEPEVPMLHRLERKVREQAPDATVLRAPAEDLPFEDDTFDAAVSTLVLCGVDDQPRALRELRRVLATRWPSPLHRARPVRRPQAGPQAGPHERHQPVHGRLRMQSPDAQHHRGGGLRRHEDRAHHGQEDPEVREPVHRG